MVQYIIQIAKGVADIVSDAGRPFSPSERKEAVLSRLRSVLDHCKALLGELERIDPRDFLPAARYPFILAKLDLDLWIKDWSQAGGAEFLNSSSEGSQYRARATELIGRIISVLDNYGGEGWRAKTREFRFVKDDSLRTIIERDYKELALVLFPGGAWKSTVVMAGSILEAILLDKLKNDPTNTSNATASSKAPKKSGVVKPFEKWRLEELIEVAADIGVIPADRATAFDQVLRDFRNFIHPEKETRAKHPCGEGEAEMAKGALDALHDIWK